MDIVFLYIYFKLMNGLIHLLNFRNLISLPLVFQSLPYSAICLLELILSYCILCSLKFQLIMF